MDSIACPGHQEEWRTDIQPLGFPFLLPCPFLHLLLGSICNTIKKIGVFISSKPLCIHPEFLSQVRERRKAANGALLLDTTLFPKYSFLLPLKWNRSVTFSQKQWWYMAQLNQILNNKTRNSFMQVSSLLKKNIRVNRNTSLASQARW